MIEHEYPWVACRYPWFAYRYPLFAYRYPLFAYRYPWFAYRYPLFAYRYPLFAYIYPWFAYRYPWFAYRYPWFAYRYSWFLHGYWQTMAVLDIQASMDSPTCVFSTMRLILPFKVSSIRTPMLIQGKLERTETNRMHFKWEATWTHGNQPSTF